MKMNFIKSSFGYSPYIFTVFLLLIVTPEIVHSHTKPLAYSYKQETSDGKYVFVMLAPKKKADGSPLNTSDNEKSLEIESRYFSSGLYLINDSSKPLWTVDWYSYKTFISSDGNYSVKKGQNYLYSTDEAISFYGTNNLIKTYKISDILDVAPILPAPFLLDWDDEIFVNEQENTLTVKTLTFDTIVFDMKTGEEISSIRPIRFIICGVLGFASAMVLLYFGKRKIKVKN